VIHGDAMCRTHDGTMATPRPEATSVVTASV
jgi:hypothetical protein